MNWIKQFKNEADFWKQINFLREKTQQFENKSNPFLII